MNKGDIAKNYFMQGYNCSQSVAMAFADKMNMDKDIVARLTCGYGGGVGRMREVCGCISGSTFVLSSLYGYENPKNFEAKKNIYIEVQAIANRFKEDNGSIVCRELLGLDKKDKIVAQPEQRTEKYYKKRPCAELVEYTAQILDEYINSKENK